MRFSWIGLILAPLLVPVIVSAAALMIFGTEDASLVPTLLAVACVVSYAFTIFLFLPCLFLLSLSHPLTGFKVCLLGMALGVAIFVSLTLITWGSLAPDSRPPIGHFFYFFVRWAADPLTALFPLSGLTTAGLYWWLGKRWSGRSAPEQ